MKKKVTFLSVKTQYENIGDALIIGSLIDLTSNFSDVYVDVSDCPDFFVNQLNSLNDSQFRVLSGSFAKFSLVALICMFSLLKFDVYYTFVPGGFAGELKDKKLYSYKLYNLFIKLLRSLNVTFFHAGMSFEKLGENYMEVLKKRRANLSYFSPRDSTTNSYIRNNNIVTDGVVPDFAFNNSYSFCKFENLEDVNKEEAAIALAFRVDNLSQIEKEKLSNFVSEMVTFYSEYDFYVVSQVKRDDAFVKELEELLSNNHQNVNFKLYNHEISQICELYKKVKYVFSNRLHSLLLSERFGCCAIPTLLPGRNHKIRAIWSDNDLENYIIDVGENVDFSCPLPNTTIKRFDFNALSAELQKFFANIYTA